MKSAINLFLLIPSLLFGAKIDGKELKDCPVFLEGIEFKVTKLAGTSSMNLEGYLSLEIKNMRDTTIALDLKSLSAVDCKGNLLNVKTMNLLRIGPGELSMFKVDLDGTYETRKSIPPGARLKETVPFTGPFLQDKKIPIKIYWKSDLLFKITK